ncbi:hypothetical protein LINGRAHAP2_LOCUS358 [Linum grandiflorum]
MGFRCRLSLHYRATSLGPIIPAFTLRPAIFRSNYCLIYFEECWSRCNNCGKISYFQNLFL